MAFTTGYLQLLCLEILWLFFSSMGMVTCGHLWESNHIQLGVKAKAKRFKNLQNIEENHSQAYNQNKSVDYNIKFMNLPKNATKQPQNEVNSKHLSNSPMLKPLLVPKHLWNQSYDEEPP